MRDDEDILIRGFGFILFILVMICLFTSCGVCHRCDWKQDVSDSVYIERVDTMFYRDTIIQVQIRDSLVKSVTNSHELSHLETDVAISDAWVEGDSLYHTLENKREIIPIQVQMPNAISRETKYHFREVTKMVERDFKWWEEALMYIGKIMLFILICFFIFKSVKIWLKR